MLLVNPSEISGRILTLLEESNSFVTLVSPYVKISKWYKLTKRLKETINRGIDVLIIVRDDIENEASFMDLEQLDLPYRKVPNLHAKIYLNERRGIVTSMNLLLSSEINSLEIGYQTEGWKEYSELQDILNRHIVPKSVLPSGIRSKYISLYMKKFLDAMRSELEENRISAFLHLTGNEISISTFRNRYWIIINNGELSLISKSKIKNKMPNQVQFVKKVSDLSAMSVALNQSSNEGFLVLKASANKKLKSHSIHAIQPSDKNYIIKSIVKYVRTLESLVQPSCF